MRFISFDLETTGFIAGVDRVVEIGAGDAQDPVVGGQLSLQVAVVERREELAEGEVTGPAEDREVARGRQHVRAGMRVHDDHGRN